MKLGAKILSQLVQVLLQHRKLCAERVLIKPQLKSDYDCSYQTSSEVIPLFKKQFKKHSLEQVEHRSGMFSLWFPPFIIYLYYLALLSAQQTQQKHSQRCYADSAPFVETPTGDDYQKNVFGFCLQLGNFP